MRHSHLEFAFIALARISCLSAAGHRERGSNLAPGWNAEAFIGFAPDSFGIVNLQHFQFRAHLTRALHQTNCADGRPGPISYLESLEESDQTLRTTLNEFAKGMRKKRPNISERKLAEYLADQMGYGGRGNVEALVASRARINKSRHQLNLHK